MSFIQSSQLINPYNLTLLILFGFVVLLIILLVFRKIIYLPYKKELNSTREKIGIAYQRLEAIFRVNQSFIEAADENEIVDQVLEELLGLENLEGVSFVAVDEHGYPRSAFSRGEIPQTVNESWLARLTTSEVRELCEKCRNYDNLQKSSPCPLDENPFGLQTKILCLPVKRGDKLFGVFNLFVNQKAELDKYTRTFVKALMEEVSLGMEGVRFRRRELETLQQIRVFERKSDFTAVLKDLLEKTHYLMEADYSVILISKSKDNPSEILIERGQVQDQSRTLLGGILKGVKEYQEPFVVEEIKEESKSKTGVRRIMLAPLLSSQDSILGAILITDCKRDGYSQREQVLVKTIAGQAALMVENSLLMGKLEYNSIIKERTRLAREIHDGLAQDLAFLKLQTAQVQKYLNQNEISQAINGLELCYKTLSDTYLDARQSIDGLRLTPDNGGMVWWLENIADDFMEACGIKVELEFEPADFTIKVPAEIQAQMIRIIQESLSNIRKHSQADLVVLSIRDLENRLIVEIVDDGVGFSPGDIARPFQHGIRGMKERAELIGAEFQIISRSGEGTRIRLDLPLSVIINGNVH